MRYPVIISLFVDYYSNNNRYREKQTTGELRAAVVFENFVDFFRVFLKVCHECMEVLEKKFFYFIIFFYHKFFLTGPHTLRRRARGEEVRVILMNGVRLALRVGFRKTHDRIFFVFFLPKPHSASSKFYYKKKKK